VKGGEEKGMGLIYEIIHKDSGKRYVGMTKKDTLAGRYHKGDWIRETCNNELRSDAECLGETAFEVSTEFVPNAELPERETSIIREYARRGIPLYNGLGAHPSFGIKKGQRQKLVAYVREQFLLRFDFTDDELVDLWTKTSSGTNKDGHSKGHNAKHSKGLLEKDMQGQPQPARYQEVLVEIAALIESVKRECPNFGYTRSSPNRIYTNMKWMKEAVAFRIARHLSDAETKNSP